MTKAEIGGWLDLLIFIIPVNRYQITLPDIDKIRHRDIRSSSEWPLYRYLDIIWSVTMVTGNLVTIFHQSIRLYTLLTANSVYQIQNKIVNLCTQERYILFN